MAEFDFGFGSTESSNENTTNNETKEEVTDIETGNKVDPESNNPIEDINEPQDNNTEEKESKEKDIKETKDKNTKEDTEELLEEGTIVEYGDKKYTADKDGNLIDEKGKLFKQTDKVNSWLKSLETEETESDPVINIDTVKKALGVEITDEEGKTIDFEDTPEGVASYVKAYVDNAQKQIAEATIDALYAKYPIIENVLNYYVANGNSLEGFNELKDRSTINLDVTNEKQCEAIIKEAWKEESRKGNVDSYIQYLKSQNILGVTAEEELKAMVERDKEAADELAKKADEAEKAQIEQQKQYWGDVYKRVTVDKKIGKYQLPETIIRVNNGQKTSATPNDFFNYIYQVDKDGRTRYENDLIKEAQENPESRVANDLIAAYLKFTGGSYESLVNMAINEQKVKTIKIKSKTTPKTKVKVTHKKSDDKSLDLGY